MKYLHVRCNTRALENNPRVFFEICQGTPQDTRVFVNLVVSCTVLSTIFNPRFKVKFFDTATTQFAIDRLIQQARESDSPMEQGHEPIQPDDDNQGET